MLSRIHEVLFYEKYYGLISILRFYTFFYNMLSTLFHLLLHIYHPILLVFIFEYLFYYNLSVFWFQNHDFIPVIYSYFKIILRKRVPCALTLGYFFNVSAFFLTSAMAVNSPQPTLSFVILCVFVSPPTLMKMSIKQLLVHKRVSAY